MWTRWWLDADRRRRNRLPARVALGHAAQRERDRLDDEVVDADLAAVAEQLVEALAEGEQRRRVELAHQVEVRDVALGLGQARAIRLRMFDAGRSVVVAVGVGQQLAGRARTASAWVGGLVGQQSRVAGCGGDRHAVGGGTDVALDDPTAGAGARDAGGDRCRARSRASCASGDASSLPSLAGAGAGAAATGAGAGCGRPTGAGWLGGRRGARLRGGGGRRDGRCGGGGRGRARRRRRAPRLASAPARRAPRRPRRPCRGSRPARRA